MPKNPFSHIDLYVPNFEAVLPFYEALLPALGFTRVFHTPAWKVFAAEGDLPSAAYFAITEVPPTRQIVTSSDFGRQAALKWTRSHNLCGPVGAKLRTAQGYAKGAY